jgi:hypothetical protein
MKEEIQSPSGSPKTSGEIESLHVKIKKTLRYFISEKCSILLQINVIGLFNNIIGDLHRERTYRFE